MRRVAHIWLISLLLVSLGLFLIYQWAKHEWVVAFGHALVIAGVLASAVDQFVKERFLKEVSLDVSKYLIGYNLPPEIQNRIRSLMNSALIRRNFVVTYRIQKASQPGKVKVDVDLEYELDNIASEPYDYKQYVAFEKHDNPVLFEMRCDSADKRGCCSAPR